MDDLDKRIAAAKKEAVYRRNYRRVRDRALRKLSLNHRAEYLELFAQERIRDEQEGKVWLDIDGRTRSGMGKTGDDEDSATERYCNREPKGYDGGEA